MAPATREIPPHELNAALEQLLADWVVLPEEWDELAPPASTRG